MRGDRSLGGGPSGDRGTTLGQRGAKVSAQCPRLSTSPATGCVRHHSALRGRVCPGPAVTQPSSLTGVTRRGCRSPRWEQRISHSPGGAQRCYTGSGPARLKTRQPHCPARGSFLDSVRGGCLPHRPRSGAGSAPWGGLRLQRSRERQAPPKWPLLQTPYGGTFGSPPEMPPPSPAAQIPRPCWLT